MKPSICIWLVLLGFTILLCGTSNVKAWNRQFFNRYSRNLLRRGGANSGGADIKTSPINSNGIDEFNALFGLNNNDRSGLINDDDQQQNEVYGIVEPLIEDLPCMDRPCNINDDCCPTGVCVNTYGEGKCVYVYGRKRDYCQRNIDCGPGMTCVRGEAGNMICQPMNVMSVFNSNVNGPSDISSGKSYEVKQYGEECTTSIDCNTAKGMCCQLQRSHHRMVPKKLCTYFRDPFMCIDILPTDNEEIRQARFRSTFNQKRM